MRDEPLWSIWEQDVAERTAGKVVKASGMTELFKADVKTDKYLIDCKYTETDSYRLSLTMWEKICSWATNESREPVVAVRIEKGNRTPYECAVLPEYIYCKLFHVDTSMVEVHEMRSHKIVNKPAVEIFQIGNHRLVSLPFERFENACR